MLSEDVDKGRLGAHVVGDRTTENPVFGLDVLFYSALGGAAFSLLYIFEIFSGEGEDRKREGGRKRSDGEDDDSYYADGYYDEP